jgi:P4 family phage/plasmid primase-like protien
MTDGPDPLPADRPAQGGLFDASARLKFEFNDRDNGRRLFAMLGDRMLYVPGWRWGCWNGRNFDFEAGEEMALQLGLEALPRAIRDEAAAKSTAMVEKFRVDAWLALNPGKSPEDAEKAIKAAARKSYRDYAIGSGNNGRVKAAFDAGSTLFRAEVTDLDADPWRITCANGVLDLKACARPGPDAEEPDERAARLAAALGPFDPSMRGTRRPAVAFDPQAECPGWRRFVRLAQPDPEHAAYLQRCMAACLAGRNDRQIALVFLGQGGNGKSTTANALARVLGGYAATCRIDMFLEGKYQAGSAATPEEAVLPGARVYLASEPESGAVLSSSKIKGLTGGEPRQSRANYGKPFIWVPHGVPVLSFNKMPRITDESEGMWRRLTPVHFTQKLHELAPEDRVTPAEMERIIEVEASGILNWMIEGWIDLAERGLAPPKDVQALKAQLRAMSDPVGEFLGDCTERQAGSVIPVAEVHKVYEAWCAENGVEPMKLRSFNKVLSDKDYLKDKVSITVWRHVAWRQEPDVDRIRDKAAGGGPPP